MPLALSDLDGSRGYRMQGAMLDFTERAPLAAVGDVNGDGYADFAIADQGHDPATGAGQVFIVYGSADGPGADLDLTALSASDGFSYSTGLADDGFGYAVTGAGDLNGDGYADVAISAPGATVGAEDDAGTVHILWGGPGGLSAGTSVEGGTYEVDFFGFTFEHGTEIGTSLDAGDLNGDGYSDLVIGGAGPAGIVYGSADGWEDPILFPAVDGGTGTPLGDVSAIIAPGDTNGDGYEDLAFAVDWFDGAWGQVDTTVYIAFGGPGGIADGFGPDDVQLGTGRIVEGIPGDEVLPGAFAAIGDINGDGLQDIAIGAPDALGTYDGDLYDGAVYIIYGGPGPHRLDAEDLGPGTGFRIVHTGSSGSTDLGYSIAGAGDVNGDGIADLVIGAPREDAGGFPDVGAAYVVYGSADGFPAILDLADLGPRQGFSVTGSGGLDWTGLAVSSAGDANGDGFADILIGGRETSALLYGVGISGISGSETIAEGNSGTTILTLTVSLSGPALNEIALSYETLSGDAVAGIDFEAASGTLIFAPGETEKTISITVFGDLDGEADEVFGIRFFDPDGAGFGGADEIVHTVTIENDDAVELQFGTDGPDTLVGGAMRDVIEGYKQDDWIEGWSGDDSLMGAHGSDTLLGGDGADTLEGGDQHDSLSGGEGLDWIYGGHGNDNVAGGADADRLFGENGHDTLDGGAGNDTLDGGYGQDSLLGGLDADSLSGGGGFDTLDGGSGADTLDGGPGADIVSGGGDADEISGGGSSDTLHGDAGGDTLYGNDGSDRLFGGEGHDLAYGGPGTDSVEGGAGLDTLYGGDGNDTLDGETDADELFGGLGADRLRGQSGDDTLKGGSGDDTLLGHDGMDWLVGGEDNDWLSGGGLADTLEGNSGADELLGAGGADSLDGGSGNDTLSGDAADDTLLGGTGDDTLLGGDGDDLLDGGPGADAYRFSGAFGHDTVVGWERGVDTLEFEGGPASFAELSITPESLGMLISWGGQSVFLAGTGFVFLTADDFTFLP